MPLNEAQLEAIHFDKGPAMVLAGPGSGKTTVITQRIRFLVEKKGIKPSGILVITFTRAAAAEMKQRYEAMSAAATEPVCFGTFHSVFFHIIRYAYPNSASRVISPEQKREIIRDLLRNEADGSNDESELVASIISEISSVKGNGGVIKGYEAQSCPDELFCRLYKGYKDELARLRMIDFDDMMLLCRELFIKRRDILAQWQSRFEYILIDEFQDINPLQYEVMRMLALPQNNIFIVGDDDQSIYRFRGARPEIMSGFLEDYPGAHIIRLDINYRSTPQIVSAAGQLIACNRKRFDKNIRANSGDGPPVSYKLFDHAIKENFQVLRDITHYHSLGIPYNEMAMLFRTNNEPMSMAETLIRMNFPFHMKDVVPNLYEHWVSQDILTYMIIGAGSKSRGDYIRIINRPKRYIRRADLAEPVIDLDKLAASYSDKPWIAERVQQLEEDIDNLSRMEPFAAVNYIRHSIGYESFLREYAEFRRLRSDELIEILDELQEASRPYRSLEEWLAHIKKYTEELNERKKTDSVQDGVWISTIHGSKGLEYKVVFILDANEGVIPHRRTNQPDEMEEERRLFYVAMTRAKTYLHIYSCKKHFGKDAQVSRFVYESLGNRLAALNDYVEDGAEGQHQDNAGTAWARLSEKTTGLYQKTTGLSQRTTGLYQNATRLSQKTTEPSRKKNTAQPYYKQDPSQRGRDILRYGWHI